MSWGVPGFGAAARAAALRDVALTRMPSAAHAPVTRALLATTVVTSVLATAGRHGAGPAVQLVRN